MKNFKKILIIALAFLVFSSSAILFSGCGNKRDWTKIRLNEVTHSIFYAPLYVAINNGYFKQEGLSIELSNGNGSNVSMSALLSNSADIILAGPETVVYTNKNRANDPVVFGQLTTCDGSFLVSKTEIEDFSIEDFKNKKVIGGRPGGMPAMTMNYMIETNGLTIGTGKDEVNIVNNIDFDKTAYAFANDSTIDICSLFEPLATDTAKAQNYYIVESLGRLSNIRMPYTCFAARKNYLKNHSDIAEKFLKAVLKGYDYIKSNTAEDVAEALQASFTTNTVEQLTAYVQNYKSIDAWSSDMILTEEGFENLMKILLHNKVIDEKAVYSNIVDNTLAEKIKAEKSAT